MARVLVVDDAKDVLEFVRKALVSAGHEVATTQTGVDLETEIERERPDLVLLDVVLPDRNGFQVLRALKRAEGTRDLPVVLLSSKGEPTDVEWGMLQGASGYLTKPFTAQGLLDSVERCA